MIIGLGVMGSEKVDMVTRAAVTLNGISIAYVMGVVNALFACLVSFGIGLTDTEIGSLCLLINAALIACVHFSHRVGEATATGASRGAANSRMEAVQIAAERRGLELHDAENPPPPTG